jgi:hypothetical protein
MITNDFRPGRPKFIRDHESIECLCGFQLCTPPGRQEGVLALSRNCMDAAAMSLELHGCGNHAV